MTLAALIFVVALAVIASERVHRTKVALLGATLAVLFVSEFNQEKAIESVDFNTIGLLAGMMILVYLTQQTGVYDYIAIRAGQLSKGRPLWVVLSLAGTTALLSAFLDNLTTILLVVPITFLLADALDIDPIPLIVIEVISSNIGGTATLIGDPPNIIIAGATDLTFNQFIVNLAPIAVITFVVVTGLLYLFYRPRLQIEERNRRYVMELEARESIRD
ncbi:MAG: SLC13 family permease, partial [Solirubrobacterales bacterium]